LLFCAFLLFAEGSVVRAPRIVLVDEGAEELPLAINIDLRLPLLLVLKPSRRDGAMSPLLRRPCAPPPGALEKLSRVSILLAIT
jgi:hypothetical protein